MLLSALALVQVGDKAAHGRQALLKWRPDFEVLLSGGDPYRALDLAREDAEGYPTLPLSALLLAPFLRAGPVTGCVLFGLLKVALAWYLVLTAMRLAAGRARDFPAWAAWVLLALGLRPLLSDLAHGNTNILVGACLAASAASWQGRRELSAGLFAALGTVLKVTPTLLLAWFLWKRSWRAAWGFALGLALFVIGIPGALLGFRRALALTGSWARQMLLPLLEAAPLATVQTEHTNQSLLGVLARWLTPSLAIRARPPVHPEDLSIHVASLERGELQLVLLAAAAIVLGWIALCSRRAAEPRDGQRTLGECSLLWLAMVLLSERSWKHHWVMLAWPVAYLLARATRPGASAAERRVAAAGLGSTALLFAASGSGLAGERGSDLLEAWGVYALGGIALLASVGLLLCRTGSGGGRGLARPSAPG